MLYTLRTCEKNLFLIALDVISASVLKWNLFEALEDDALCIEMSAGVYGQVLCID